MHIFSRYPAHVFPAVTRAPYSVLLLAGGSKKICVRSSLDGGVRAGVRGVEDDESVGHHTEDVNNFGDKKQKAVDADALGICAGGFR